MTIGLFLRLQCAAFVFFGVTLTLIPGPLLEGIYRVDDLGDTGWIRLFGGTLLGVGYMEWVLIQNLAENRAMVEAWIAVPAILTVVFAYNLINGTEVYNDAFSIVSLCITSFFTAGHLWFRTRKPALV